MPGTEAAGVAAAMIEAGLRQFLEVVFAVEGTIRYQGGRPVGRLQLADVLADDLAKGGPITAMATARLHQHGNARSVFNDQLQDDLVEVRAMIATLALGDVHNLFLGLLVAVGATIDMKARRIEVHRGWTQAQTLGGAHRPETVEFRHPLGIEGIQGPTEGIIIELCGGDAGRNESRGWLMVEEPGDQGERVMDKPQTIEHHRFHGFTHCEVPHFRVLVGGLVEDVANAEFVAHPSDKSQVVQDVAAVHRLVGHDNLL